MIHAASNNPVTHVARWFLAILLSQALQVSAESSNRHQAESGVDYLVLEDFSSSRVGDLPQGWKWRNRDDAKAKSYIVQQQGNHRFVAAADTGLSVILLRATEWNPRHYPIMTWCWRADALPVEADERYTETNDSAAGVYVVFSQSWIGIPRQIKYVWSTTLPVGTVGRRDKFARPWFVVLESGEERLGQWVLETVDLEKDEKKILDSGLPKEMMAIGILTDGNSTRSPAAAAYAEFRVWTREALAQGIIDGHCPCERAIEASEAKSGP